MADFIARSDGPAELRGFFIGRGITPSDTPAPDFDEPLLDTDESGVDCTQEEGESALTFRQRLANMGGPENVKCAIKGMREMRPVLIRAPSRMVASAVLSCPQGHRGGSRCVRQQGECLQGHPAHHRQHLRVEQKLRRDAQPGKEFEDPGGDVNDADAAPYRERRDAAGL